MSAAQDLPYVGGELELFARARNWKRYFAAKLRPYVGGDVLEVGAGMGGATAALCTGKERSWRCLEPDLTLCRRISAAVSDGRLPSNVSVEPGTLAGCAPGATFDTILYIDVLEHIEDDRAELTLAADRLAPSGRLVVLAPAHQRLFSAFDTAVGHFRRYSSKTLMAAAPGNLAVERVFYLDSIGLVASAANAFLLGRKQPSRAQIALWDGVMAPVSRLVDPLFGFTVGKTVVGVWRKSA